jgi:hypothetical protein
LSVNLGRSQHTAGDMGNGTLTAAAGLPSSASVSPSSVQATPSQRVLIRGCCSEAAPNTASGSGRWREKKLKCQGRKYCRFALGARGVEAGSIRRQAGWLDVPLTSMAAAANMQCCAHSQIPALPARLRMHELQMSRVAQAHHDRALAALVIPEMLLEICRQAAVDGDPLRGAGGQVPPLAVLLEYPGLYEGTPAATTRSAHSTARHAGGAWSEQSCTGQKERATQPSQSQPASQPATQLPARPSHLPTITARQPWLSMRRLAS